MDKEQQKKLLTEIMEADRKNGLYDIPGVEKKMTVVEWLVKKLSNELIGEIPLHRWDEIRDAVQTAKQMEKAQIMRAAMQCHFDGVRQSAKTSEEYIAYAEQYYNETYGKE